MAKAVIFNGANSLDFTEIRHNVIRIPEVSRRLGEAQRIWEKTDKPSFNFHNFLNAEDAVFLGNIKLKGLAATIVQVGLYDRFVRLFGAPDFLTGNVNGDSALRVCSGEISFAELVQQSNAVASGAATGHLQLATQPMLSGISLAEYGVVALTEATGESVDGDSPESKKSQFSDMDLKKVLQALVETLHVKRFINIGPGNSLTEAIHQSLALSDVEFVESIDIDPMLSWFWSNLRANLDVRAVGN